MQASDVADEFRTPHELVELAHGSLAYWSFGSGPDLVFVHGWPLHGATFRRIIPHLAAGFRCHVFDLPGTGHTTWAARAPFGMWEHAHTLNAALSEVGIDRYGLVAHDSGGTIARLLATLTPDRVTSIVLGNTEIPAYDVPTLRWGKLAVALPGIVTLTRLAARSRWVVETMFKSCFDDLAQLRTDFGEFFIEPLKTDPEYIRGQFRLVKHLDWNVVMHELADVHRKIEVPVLLIWGQRDPWFPWSHAEAMVDSFGGPPAEVNLIERGKLFAHEEFAPEFGKASLEFLKRHA